MDKEAKDLFERVVELSGYVPEFLRECMEMKELYRTEENELVALYHSIDALWDISLIQKAGLQGIKRYEAMLGLPSNSRLSLEERRAAILMKWNRQLPYTLRRLAEQLMLWSGNEPFVVDTSRFREYMLRIEVFNQTLAALRGIKETVNEMIPANLILFLYGRYPAKYEVPISYDNAIHFQSSFHPRYNLSFLSLDRTWSLDNKRKLSGYDSEDYLDFYPVQFQIQTEAREDVQTEERIRFSCESQEEIEIANAIRLQTEAMQEIRAETQMHMQVDAWGQIDIHTGSQIKTEVWQEIATGEQLEIQTLAAEEIGAGERIQIQGEAAYQIETASYMTKMNQTDATWSLNGSRKLDGGRYVL